MLDPRASSEVEPKDGPADPRPLRNVIQGAARLRAARDAAGPAQRIPLKSARVRGLRPFFLKAWNRFIFC